LADNRAVKDALLSLETMNQEEPRVVLLDGWYLKEADGTVWSLQQSRALVKKHVNGTGCLLLTGILPHAADGGNNVLEIESGGHLVARISNRSSFFRKFTRRLNLKRFAETPLEIKFSLSHQFCPHEAGNGSDERALGFALCTLSFQKVFWPARYWHGWRQDLRYLLSLGLDLLRKNSINLAKPSSSWINETQCLGTVSASPTAPGLSIVIFAGADLSDLHGCLRSVQDARSAIHEPVEVLVISEHRHIKELITAESSWATGVDFKILEEFSSRRSSTRKALEECQYNWVYFLESTNQLDPASLQNGMNWRAPHIFAIASRMTLGQESKEPTETGWTDWQTTNGRLEFFDRTPANYETVRGTLYSHQIGSLFHKSTLQELMHQTRELPLNYPEEIEWGIRAWKMGRESLFCPMSVIHSPALADRGRNSSKERAIDSQNTLLFLLRNSIFGLNQGQLLAELFYELKWTSLTCIFNLSAFNGVLRQPFYFHPHLPLSFVCLKYFIQPWNGSIKPHILLVSPFAVYPTAHGGAVRMHQLMRALSQEYRVHLLSDEQDLYPPDSSRYFGHLASVHLTGGRWEGSNANESRIQRVINHSHAILEEQFKMLVNAYRPVAIQIEYVELAGLVRNRTAEIPWFLNLHDVLFSEQSPGASEEDRYEANLVQQFDAVFTCSHEDARLVPHKNVFVVPNGVDDEKCCTYQASGDSRRVLFVGPFRSAQNLLGISIFLNAVYPSLLRDIEGLELWIVAGRGGREMVRDNPAFSLPGIVLVDYVEDMQALLNQCALTTNPLYGVRGSCLKIVESLRAGRVVLSTREGARGFIQAGLKSLLIVEKIEDFGDPLRHLLLDPQARMALEYLPASEFECLTWRHSGKILLSIYHSILGRGTTGA
jgi:hypothetical protein